MGKTTQANLNAKGHRIQEEESATRGSATVGEATGVAIGNILYLAADGLLYKFEGSEDPCAAIVGVADGTYAQTVLCYFFRLNSVMPAAGTFTAGDELWAKHDATITNWAGLTSLKFTKRMGVAISTTKAQLADGEVVQVP
jgi:hypothetical protein